MILTRKTVIVVSALLYCNSICAQNIDTKIDTLSLVKTVTGSAATVSEDQMNKGLVNNALDALSGKAAGVNVSSNGADRMAMLSSVRVRGTTSLTGGNDPLVIIDGVYSDLSTLSTVYPADIESFTILKNAAETAQYGSRGASGVIVVKTKKGHGQQFHISYDVNGGFESVYKNINMLNRSEYISTAKTLGTSYNDGGYDTNFLEAITRTGYVQNHHMAFSGGGEKSNYRASIGFMDHNTIIKINKYQNFVAKLDLSQKAFDDILTIDFGVFGSSQNSKNIFDTQKLFYSAAAQNPTYYNGMNSSGGWDKNSTASQINNPLALLKEKNDEKNLNFNTHIQFLFEVARHLKAILFGSYSYNSTENSQFCPTWVWAQGQAYRGEHKNESWLGNIQLDYNRKWGIHSIDILALSEYQHEKKTGFYTLVKGFTSNLFGYNNLAAASIRPWGGTGSGYEEPSLASVMGRLSYTIMDKYNLQVTMRTDGSSMVGKNNTWGYFPSISAEWNIKKENFAKALTWLNEMKLRTGYGSTGNLGGISSYNSLQALMPNGIVSFNGSPTITMGELKNANPDLKWETRSTFNIGTDLAFFNNRLILTAEYYYSKTKDMLYMYDVSVPPFTYDKMLTNLGSMSNSGFEFGVGVTPIDKHDMELNINVNLSFQNNKLISLSGYHNGEYLSAAKIIGIGGLNGAGFHGGENNILYQIIGQPLGVFYLPHCTGLKKASNGTYTYEIEDINKNGKVNIEDGGDRYIAGQATPKMTLGSNISFRYKNYDVSLQINGAFGHKIYNGTSLTYMNMSSFPDYNVMTGAPQMNINDQTATDYWLESGDYINFDYLTIGWNIPIKAKYINALRLSGSVNNIFTITSYSGLTPIINSYVVNSTLGIDDKRSYPPYRSFSMAISIRF